MARIAGINIPLNKRAEIGLTYIYGVGRPTANEILKATNIEPDRKVRDLTEDEVARLREAIDDLTVEASPRTGRRAHGGAAGHRAIRRAARGERRCAARLARARRLGAHEGGRLHARGECRPRLSRHREWRWRGLPPAAEEGLRRLARGRRARARPGGRAARRATPAARAFRRGCVVVRRGDAGDPAAGRGALAARDRQGRPGRLRRGDTARAAGARRGRRAERSAADPGRADRASPRGRVPGHLRGATAPDRAAHGRMAGGRWPHAVRRR